MKESHLRCQRILEYSACHLRGRSSRSAPIGVADLADVRSLSDRILPLTPQLRLEAACANNVLDDKERDEVSADEYLRALAEPLKLPASPRTPDRSRGLPMIP